MQREVATTRMYIYFFLNEKNNSPTWTDTIEGRVKSQKKLCGWIRKQQLQKHKNKNGWRRKEQSKDILQVSPDGRRRNQKNKYMEEERRDSQRQKMTKMPKLPKNQNQKSERKALPKTFKPDLSRIRLTPHLTPKMYLSSTTYYLIYFF